MIVCDECKTREIKPDVRKHFYLKLYQFWGENPGEKVFCDWPCLIKYAQRWLKIEQIEKP